MQIQFIESLENIDENKWNNLINSDYPFLKHAFLFALEKCKCVGENTGWYPFHIIVEEGEEIIALMPMYIKSDSHGEFIFDWSWANAYYRNGLEYYPKLVSAIPFTPATGPRLCILNENQRIEIISLIKKSIEQISNKLELSSAHILLPIQKELDSYLESGFNLRTSYSFHWFNNGYDSFNDFLNDLTSRQRKNIKKERSKILGQEIYLERIQGKDITEEIWSKFYDFYQLTYLKRGMQAYLSLEFFLEIALRMPESLLLVIARDIKNKKPIAGALNFQDTNILYGRYWGCLEEYDSLHFEACYYQGIEYCIEKNLKRFDPGVQGEHKIKRGFFPIETHSVHWIKDARFNKVIEDFLEREKIHIQAYNERCRDLLPFKSSVVKKIYSCNEKIKHKVS